MTFFGLCYKNESVLVISHHLRKLWDQGLDEHGLKKEEMECEIQVKKKFTVRQKGKLNNYT